MDQERVRTLPSVVASIAYLDATDGRVGYRVHPPSTGKPPESPPKRHHTMTIVDCRALASELAVDRDGFALLRRPTTVADLYDDGAVKRDYYPETEALMRAATGAHSVIAFDHNVRAAKGAPGAAGRANIRMPVDMAHNDYTESSGPKRAKEILTEAGRLDLDGRRFALINAWRPIRGPVQDIPLTICAAESVSTDDFVDTVIEHYGDADPTRPQHTGEIYSFRHRPDHRWFYVSDMTPDEVLLLKCFDSARDGRARYTAHTGFVNPNCPPQFSPRESIEVRTLVVY